MKDKPALSGVREIARRANVSIGTVDRVIHNRPGVSEATRLSILEIIKELNYQPNIMARRLATKKNVRYAILIPEISEETEFWKAPLTGIELAETEISQFGVQIDRYFFDQNDKHTFLFQAENVLKYAYDGILLAPSFIEESISFTRKCQEMRIPYVFINSDLAGQDSLCYIGPDLYKSGYLAAHILHYAVQEGTILVLNISREIDNQHHLLRKEDGLRAYFQDYGKKNAILKMDVRQTDHASLELHLASVLKQHPEIKAIFVSNSRVASVARFLEDHAAEHIILIGYDYLDRNIEYLKKGIIDFLICQKPQEQGYKGIMALFQSQVSVNPIEKVYSMPIDIVTKENYLFYRN